MSSALLAVLANLAEAKEVELPTNIAANDFSLAPADAYAEIKFNSSGTYTNTRGAGGIWKFTGAAGDYDIRFTYTGGSIGLTSGTWYNLGTTRTASLSQSTGGVNSANGTIDIRRTASGAIKDTCTFSIEAEESL